jgi:hypothetical protein
MSCDAYSDLWTPFFTLLDCYWPDCPFPVFLGAGELDCGLRAVTTLKSGGGRDWSKCFQDCLEQLETKYVLVMLDDFFLRRKVSTSEVLKCLRFALMTDAVQLRLIPRPRPTGRLLGEKLIGESGLGSPYRVSTQAAIWNRMRLLEMLRPGETIWEFEYNANARADELPGGFYSVWRPVLPYQGTWAHHVVEKGKWFFHEKWIFGRQNIGCDFSRRETLPLRQTVFYHLAQTVDRLLDFLPWQAKARCKRLLKKSLRPFLGRALDRLGQAPARSRPVS